MFGHASTSGSIYKTDSLFSAPGRRGWVVGIHVPCDGGGGGWWAYTYHAMAEGVGGGHTRTMRWNNGC